MHLNLFLNMDSPAFTAEDNGGRESARILRDLADRIDGHPHFSEGHSQCLSDSNGKEVGNMWIAPANRWQVEPEASMSRGPVDLQPSTSKELYDYCEAIADITGSLVHAQAIGRTNIEDSREVVAMAIKWAGEFHAMHKTTDWTQIEYIETVDAFTEAKMVPFLVKPVATQPAMAPLPQANHASRSPQHTR